jgi:hypothetical protein
MFIGTWEVWSLCEPGASKKLEVFKCEVTIAARAGVVQSV